MKAVPRFMRWGVVCATLAIAFLASSGGNALRAQTPPNFTQGHAFLGIDDQARFEEGLEEFSAVETADDGVGPIFNDNSCAACHTQGGIGGGSTLDTAKALMIGTASGKLDDLVALLAKGAPFTPARVKRLIAIPTTAGTGSEVTPYATIWDAAPDRQKKYSLMLKETWAEAAIVDPELTLSLPPTVTLHSALDALSHSLEAIWNVNANPVSDVLAVAAAREILAKLPPLMARPGDLELRTRVAWAALTAGLAFSNTKTALAHSISYEMTLKHGLPHGLACSFTLPMVLARAVGRSPARDAVLARIFDCPLTQAERVLQDFLEGLGVSTRFESYGVAAGEPERMVRDALEGVRGKNFIGASA